MAQYAIKKPLVVKKEHSVDGKSHRKTLWYQGCMDFGFGSCPVWSKRQDRKIFSTKSEANKIAKRFSDIGIEVVKV